MWVLISTYKSLLTESSLHCSQCKSNHSLYDHSFKSDPKPLVKERRKARKASPAAGRHMRHLRFMSSALGELQTQKANCPEDRWDHTNAVATRTLCKIRSECSVGSKLFCNWREPRIESIISPLIHTQPILPHFSPYSNYVPHLKGPLVHRYRCPSPYVQVYSNTIHLLNLHSSGRVTLEPGDMYSTQPARCILVGTLRPWR